uniref:1-alkyl-2-acetylglycerophosphocholine esterase n=2 Tax=Macrostomum lignano TaxID=282301 RepID=A0A1I8HBR4_9PLAT
NFVYQPSGAHNVGAFDLLTECGTSGVLARIYYPTETPVENGHRYTEPEYVHGLLDFLHWSRWLRGFFAWAASRLRLCCAWHAPLIGADDNNDWVKLEQSEPADAATSPSNQEQQPQKQQKQRLPMIIFSHGLGGQRHVYSAICLDLASHGFIVASVEHRDGSGSCSFFLPEAVSASYDGDSVDAEATATTVIDKADLKRLRKQQEEQRVWLHYEKHVLSDYPYRNKQVRHRAAEAIQLTDTMLRLHRGQAVSNWMPGCTGKQFDWLLAQFKDRIDTNRIHIMGHSFGAATALTAAITAPEGLYQTCSLHDVWMHPVDPELYRKLKVPVLFLNNEHFHWVTNVARAREVLESPGLSMGMSTVLTIRGTNHAAQSDSGLYAAFWLSKRMGLTHALEPREALQLSSRVTQLFIARHEGRRRLTEDENELLNGDRPDICFPEFAPVPDEPRHT